MSRRSHVPSPRMLLAVVALLIVGQVLGRSAWPEVHAATLRVNSTADDPDVTPGDGLCATVAGVCTLRAAIQEANALAETAPGDNGGPPEPVTDAISFAIPGTGVRTITPLSSLPLITAPVDIDGTTQPGFAGTPIVELNGASAGGDGLRITAGESTIRGFVINRFPGSGIRLETNGANAVMGNYIGTDPSGTVVLGNAEGVSIVNSSYNLIGGDEASARNVISGNSVSGVHISGTSATSNVLAGNSIGTNAAGTVRLSSGTGAAGVVIDDAPRNTIGGTASGIGNVVSGNGHGVVIRGIGATDNQLLVRQRETFC